MAKRKVRRRQEIPKDESKADRFIRVVTPRVKKAVKSISVIGFCSGVAYDFTPEQVLQINAALTTAVEALTERYTKSPQVESEFGFD